MLGPPGLLYVSTREYAVHPHTRHQGAGGRYRRRDDWPGGHSPTHHLGCSGPGPGGQTHGRGTRHLPTESRLAGIRLWAGRTELHLVGAFADSKGLGSALVSSTLSALHRQRTSLELVTLCVGELCTVRRSGTPWPLLYGLGVNVKTGDIFPAQFTDKGPDMDLRTARTLTGGETVGLMDIYDYQREELRIGPFTLRTNASSRHLAAAD